MPALPPWSAPYWFRLENDPAAPTNPWSAPLHFTLTTDGRPGPWSAPAFVDTRAYVWFVAADGGWQEATLSLA